jgi:hypothetical protein
LSVYFIRLDYSIGKLSEDRNEIAFVSILSSIFYQRVLFEILFRDLCISYISISAHQEQNIITILIPGWLYSAAKLDREDAESERKT